MPRLWLGYNPDVPVIGLLGLPGSGKSTVFKALTHQAVPPQFLGYDLKPHQAVVKIPDARLDWLAEHYKSRNVVYATVEFIDIPGFDPAATEAKLKNAVLEHYRRCDALVLVADMFSPEGRARAARNVSVLLEELVLLDLVTAERQCAGLEKAAKHKADQESVARYEALTRVKARLEEGEPVRGMELSHEEERLLRDTAFLSEKQVILLLNVAEDDYAKADAEIGGLSRVLELADGEGLKVIRFAAELEAMLAGMEPNEAREYMAEYGVTEPALKRFIRAASECLSLVTFLTASDKESRAWTLRAGSNAQAAAGVIHSDLARGFIRAETVAFDDLVQYGNLVAARGAGKVRLEGKDYIVADGDVLHIRFNV